MEELFSVCQFFPDGGYEYVVRRVNAETAVTKAKALTNSVGGRMGTTRRVIIVDGGDSIVFEWVYRQGITFPKPVRI